MVGGRFYVLYVDFQKEFDGLLHHDLFSVLHKVGVRGKILRAMIYMYSNYEVLSE